MTQYKYLCDLSICPETQGLYISTGFIFLTYILLQKPAQETSV